MNNEEILNRSSVVVRRAKATDIEPIAKHMRKEEVDEIWASNNWLPKEALEYGFINSELCYTITFKGEPVAMFGLVSNPDIKEYASIWMLGTDRIKEMKITFLKKSKSILDMLLEYYPMLYNFVDVRHETSVEWLKWCGANIMPPIPYGPENRLFSMFTIRRN